MTCLRPLTDSCILGCYKISYSLYSMTLVQNTFENNVVKEEIARNEQSLPPQQCFVYLIRGIKLICTRLKNCRLYDCVFILRR